MNYYISGMTGFIGASIARYLNDRGGTDIILPIRRGQSIDELTERFRRVPPDYIIHTASYGNHNHQTDFVEMVNANIINTYNILEAASSFSYTKFYHISTSSVILEKQTKYSITKHCGEQIAVMYKNVVIVRPYSVFGPGEASHRFIPTVISHLNSGDKMILDEQATHAWLYIDDLIEALFRGETDLGNKIVFSNKEIAEILEDISGKKLNYFKSGKLRDYDDGNWPAGNVECNVYEGLKRTYKYYTT